MTGEPYLNINCEHLRKFEPELYRQLICYPQEVIPTMDMAVCDLFMETYPQCQTVEKMLEIRPYNADKTKNMRSLNPEGQ